MKPEDEIQIIVITDIDVPPFIKGYHVATYGCLSWMRTFTGNWISVTL